MSNKPSDPLVGQIGESMRVDFVPFAFYDHHMDYIRIELRDCSTFERRINEVFTLVFDNYPEEGQAPIAGLVIKGVKHLFTDLGLPLEGVHLVASLLDRIVKSMQLDEPSQQSIQLVQNIASTIEMPVRMAA